MTGPGQHGLVEPVARRGDVVVWRGWDPGLRRFVAIKQAPVGAVDAAARLRTEAHVLGGLDHRHIVVVYNVLETPDDVWLIEEWVDGVTIPELLRTARALSVHQSVGVLHGALEGLAYVHGRGVVHGDISPSNILVAADGVSKLVDFGAASTDMMRPVRSFGTPGYMSPQVASGDLATRRDDVYSSAAVAAMLLRGRPLFTGPTAEAVIAAQLRAPEPDLGGISRAIRGVLGRALSGSPDRRFSDGAEFLDAVDDAARDDLARRWLADAGLAGLVAAAAPAGVTAVLAAGAAAGGPVAPHAAPPPAPAPSAPPSAPAPSAAPSSAPSPSTPSGSASTGGSTPPPSSAGTASRPSPGRGLRGSRHLPKLLRGPVGVAVVSTAAVVLFVAAVFSGYRIAHHPKATPTQLAGAQTTGTTSGSSPSPSATVKPAALTWSSAVTVDGSQLGMNSVSCATPTSCVAVDGNANALVFDGSHWGSAVLFGAGTADTPLSSISCPDASHCFADSLTHGYVYEFDGHAWTSSGPAIDAGPNALVNAGQMSCPTTTFCAVGDRYDQEWIFDGTKWSGPSHVGPDQGPGIGKTSCASASFCMATVLVDGNAGDVAVFRDGRWSPAADVDPGHNVAGVSCVGDNFCAVVDDGGRALTYDGTSWSPPTVVSKQYMSAVSCASVGHCVAVGFQGVVATLDSGKWTARTIGHPAGQGLLALADVSCPTVDFCMAIDNAGQAVMGT